MKRRNIFLTVLVIVLVVGAFLFGRLTVDSYDEMRAQIEQQDEVIDAYQRQIGTMQELLQSVQDAISGFDANLQETQSQTDE